MIAIFFVSLLRSIFIYLFTLQFFLKIYNICELFIYKITTLVMTGPQ